MSSFNYRIQTAAVTDRPHNAAPGAAGPVRDVRPSRRALLASLAQLAIMVDTGVNLATALESVAAECSCRKLAPIWQAVGRDVRDGQQLSQALGRWPRAFTGLMVNLVRAGEASGHLATMLQRLEEFLLREQEARARLRSALAYPAIMITVALAVVGFLIGYVLPNFKGVFKGKEHLLPLPTTVLMGVGDFMEAYGGWVMLGLALLGAAGAILVRHPRSRPRLDRLLLVIPVVGHFVRMSCIARSLRALGIMLRGGVSILEAISITGALSGHSSYREHWRCIHAQVQAGESLTRPLGEGALYPRSIVHMVGTGERTGRLHEVLEKLGLALEQELALRLKDVTSMLEPLLIIGMGVVVVGIAMSLMLPMFTIAQTVQ